MGRGRERTARADERSSFALGRRPTPLLRDEEEVIEGDFTVSGSAYSHWVFRSLLIALRSRSSIVPSGFGRSPR